MSREEPVLDVGVLGGSGLYELAGIDDARAVTVETPYGPTSDAIRVGTLGGRRVGFLARHGRNHDRTPTEVPYRANVWAFKKLGARWLLSASAVGSLRESIAPRHVVLVDQFVDRTRLRPSTFFGDGLVAHVSMADPVCPQLRARMFAAAAARAPQAHDGGTYLCMEGPAFSTRAESELYRAWGMDVIGMTNLQEARLAREAELCYATLALVTDYDCWHEEEEDVNVAALLAVLRDNAKLAADVLAETVAALEDADRESCGCAEALRHALITPAEAVPAETRRRLAPIVAPYLDVPGDS